MNRAHFESELRILLSSNSAGYNDAHWTIKYDTIGREYYARWTNRMNGGKHREFACYIKDGVVKHI